MSGISKVFPTPLVLKNLGACETDGTKIFFNNSSVLFFSKNLNDHYFHTAVTCAIYKGNEKATVLNRKDFNDLIYQTEKSIRLYSGRLPSEAAFTTEPRIMKPKQQRIVAKVDDPLTAPDGTSLNVRTAWYISPGVDAPRFVTAHPLPKL